MKKYNNLTEEMELFSEINNVKVDWIEECGVFWLSLQDNVSKKSAKYLVGNSHAVQAMTFEYILSVLQDLLKEVRE